MIVFFDNGISDMLPGKALNQIETEKQSYTNVHFQPEHEICGNCFHSLLVFNEENARAREQDKQHWVEVPQGHADNCLMDNSRNQKCSQFRNDHVLSAHSEEPSEVKVDVIVKEVMDNDIPFPVIRAKFSGVPPIRIESSVGETSNFGPEIHPAVKEAKEPKN